MVDLRRHASAHTAKDDIRNNIHNPRQLIVCLTLGTPTDEGEEAAAHLQTI
jgi:hypothetical protein